MSNLKHIRSSEVDTELSDKAITIIVYLETRVINKDKKHPIKLRVTHKRNYKSFVIKKLSATKEEFNSIAGKKPRGEYKEKRRKINSQIKRAFNIIKLMDIFSFDEFTKKYLKIISKQQNNVFDWYEEKINELLNNGQISTAITYEYSQKALKKFTNKDYLKFDEVTVKFLNDFEKWFLTDNKSKTSLGIYLRALRHIYNNARENKLMNIKSTPFGESKDKYSIKTTENTKRALTRSEVDLIKNYKAPNGSPEEFYRNLWLFSYYGNGINFKDVCLLKYSNINYNNIEFVRSKTQRTTKKTKKIIIPLTDNVRNIIDKFGSKPPQPDNYIFDIIKPYSSPEEQYKDIKQVVKQCNKYIKRIAINVGIDKNISTYTARHTYATILKNAGISAAIISENLGHSSLVTTESYLDSIETEQGNEIANLL